MQAMQGSSSEHSYARHSGAQNFHFHCLAKPRLEQAIQHLISRKSALVSDMEDGINKQATIADNIPWRQRPHFVVADLGCAYGRNTLECAEFVVSTLLRHFNSSEGAAPPPASCDGMRHGKAEIQYFFSDLPSNDFNALFLSLQPYLMCQQSDSETLNPPPKFFAAGVPGSFYGRLFPTASLDLAISCCSLHWLSQVPPNLVDKTSPAWNGGHTWISKVRPSQAVAIAYARQSEMDVKTFLRRRADELRSGGILFLLLPGRSSDDTPEGDHSVPFHYTSDVLDYAWKEMVDEGKITQEEMDTFNIMFYFLNQQELESSLKEVPELRPLHIESINNMSCFAKQGNRRQAVEQWMGVVASGIKPAMEAHVGKGKADELFKKLKSICLEQACFDARLICTPVVASLQRI